MKCANVSGLHVLEADRGPNRKSDGQLIFFIVFYKKWKIMGHFLQKKIL